MNINLLQGDCRITLKTLSDCSVDSIVTDPPYHLTTGKKGGSGPASVNLESPYGRARIGTGFMGMKWDGGDVAFQVEMWAECLRVLKPGGHLLAFSGTRTQHRMVCAIEDAGFEIRDQAGWMYGSGFPKSLDVSKAIDKAQGDESREWQGWGTALKPAWEPICVARKPLIGTVAANVLVWGTGALNIDGCRVAGNVPQVTRGNSFGRMNDDGWQESKTTSTPSDLGRWPANVIHDGSDEVLAVFPTAPGQLADVSTIAPSPKTSNVYGAMKREGEPSQDNDNEGVVGFKMKPGARRLDEGSAARFFKECKSVYSDAWHAQNPTLSDANTAEQSSFLRSLLGVFVQSAAATLPSLEGIVSDDSKEPSINATPSESKLLNELVIATMLPIAFESSQESQLERLSPTNSLVSVAVNRAPTGTTTITASLSRSDGSAGSATFSITPSVLDRGGAGSNFKYCPKASKRDRGADNSHPTVKPTDLMRYLCRLVTPARGVVLDPFLGSGSTGKAAILEGFSFIGCELNPEYLTIAKARIDAAVGDLLS